MTTPESRAELRRLHAASPWKWNATALMWILRYASKYDGMWTQDSDIPGDASWPGPGDAELICKEHDDCPALCDEVDALEAEVARLREALNDAQVEVAAAQVAQRVSAEQSGGDLTTWFQWRLDAIRKKMRAALAPPTGKDGK